MSLGIFVNVIKLILHNLENTEFSTEFRVICSLIQLTLSTPHFGFQTAVALFCVNLRNLGVTLHKKTQSGKHGIFRGTLRGIFLKVLKSDSKLFQMVKI